MTECDVCICTIQQNFQASWKKVLCVSDRFKVRMRRTRYRKERDSNEVAVQSFVQPKLKPKNGACLGPFVNIHI